MNGGLHSGFGNKV